MLTCHRLAISTLLRSAWATSACRAGSNTFAESAYSNTSGVTLPSANIPNLPTGELTKETGELKSLEGQAGAYQKQLTQLKKDSAENAQKLEKEFEDKVQGRTEVKAIKDKQLEVEKMKKLHKQYMEKTAQYRNPQMIEKEIRQNSANIANSVLASQEKSVQAAQSKLAKAKKKYGEFESINHLPKRPVNPMKEVPFRERLFPGFCLQMTGGEFVSLDVAPQAYYKITTRLDAGAGFVYRVNYDFKKSTFVNNNNLYGFKLFTNVKVYNHFAWGRSTNGSTSSFHLPQICPCRVGPIHCLAGSARSSSSPKRSRALRWPPQRAFGLQQSLPFEGGFPNRLQSLS